MNMSAVSAGPTTSNLDGIVALVSEEMKLVEARLAERMESPIGSIPQVGAHLLGAGGKRLLFAMIRPVQSRLDPRSTICLRRDAGNAHARMLTSAAAVEGEISRHAYYRKT